MTITANEMGRLSYQAKLRKDKDAGKKQAAKMNQAVRSKYPTPETYAAEMSRRGKLGMTKRWPKKAKNTDDSIFTPL